MVDRQWSHERLLKWARRLKVTVPLGTSDEDLQRMVMRAPAMDWQWLELYDAMTNRNIGLPPVNLTFKQAIAALDVVSTADNEFFLEVMALQEGQILFVGDTWGTPLFIAIMRIYGTSNQCKLRVVPVTLEQDVSGCYKPRIAGNERTIHPRSLYLLSIRVDTAHFVPSDWRMRDWYCGEYCPDDPPF